MTPLNEIPLESYRLAQYTQNIECYVCDEPNLFDAELCRYCHAPMALAHQANSQKLRPRMVGTIGPSCAGKTVYLGMLMDMLSREAGDMRLLARGAFSVTLQQSVVNSLARCRFPDKTPNEPDQWNWVHGQVMIPRQRRPVELIMPDMAGESLMEEVDHPHSYPVIHSFLKQCGGVQVLIDASRLEAGDRDADYFAMKLLTYLCELEENEKHPWQKRPVALVFSKADECQWCFDDPDAFASKYTRSLWQYCRQRLRNYKFFASGVAGTCGHRDVPGLGPQRIPLRLEPRGIVEPFEWMVRRLGR
ncbi:MAG: hypothetical protein MI757_22240 [Pirellulales bacterium]|nr:hypothetical protein [Pirellulales bacterium]